MHDILLVDGQDRQPISRPNIRSVKFHMSYAVNSAITEPLAPHSISKINGVSLRKMVNYILPVLRGRDPISYLLPSAHRLRHLETWLLAYLLEAGV